MSEADSFSSPIDLISIVVAGNMNPAIHHPAWYKVVNALSDDELGSTVLTGGKESKPQFPLVPGAVMGQAINGPICTPALSQFTAGAIRIVCIEPSWTISTYKDALLGRIREVATSVFDVL